MSGLLRAGIPPTANEHRLGPCSGPIQLTRRFKCMNLQSLITFAQTLPAGLTPESFFSKMEAEFGRHSGGLKMFKSMHSKWTDGKNTVPAAQAIFENLSRSSSVAKPAPAQKPAAVSAIVPALRAQPAVAAAQSLAARLGISETKVCTRSEFGLLTPRQKSEFSKNGGRLSE